MFWRFKSIKFCNRKAQTIILVIVFLTLLVGLCFLKANPPKQTASWAGANQVVPERVLAVAIRQNYNKSKSEKPLDKNQIKALKVPSRGGDNLYVIDFNTPLLCGAGGCLYAVYTQQGKLVMSLLLNPNLPKETSLFSLSEETRNEFPCLMIAQPTGEEYTVSRGRYCYEGAGFTLVNSSVTKGGA